MQKHFPMSSGREPRFEIDLFLKCTPYMDAIKRFIFNCKGDNVRFEKSFTCYFLKLSVKTLLELDLARKDKASNIALEAFQKWHFTVCIESPIETFKSYGFNSYLIS